MNIQHSSRSDRWFTPRDILARVRHVLGTIDLDPASEAAANDVVQAETYYTAMEDGLTRQWHGRVFLNPPGGKRGNKSMTALFWRKLMTEVYAGRVQQAVFLAF